jgi:hemerythrin-like metal-binding protein
MPWVEELAMQSEELNADHREILQKLNGLLHALDSGDRSRIAMACSLFCAEAQAHFANEKQLMLACDYPDSAAHIEQHEDLMRSVACIQVALTSGNGTWTPMNAISMLEKWFVPHLTHADRRLADFMAAQGATS